jgi:hypothetical protein
MEEGKEAIHPITSLQLSRAFLFSFKVKSIVLIP